MLTFSEAKKSRLSQVSQSCVNSDDFKSLLNEATERLMRRGDWPGLVVPIYLCVKSGCVVWPRYVSKVRRINKCHSDVKVGNLWYDFIAGQSNDFNRWFGTFNAGGINRFFNPQYRMVNKGFVCTYADIPATNCLIRFYPLCQADVGKTIQIFGLDNNGQPLQTRMNSTTWVEGITVTLALPFGTTSVYVRQIDRVIKDVTQKNVQGYAYDVTRNMLFDIAVYEPSETLPSYEKDQLYLNNCCCDGQSVSALVKLKYIPVETDTDLVLIDNITALKYAIQAIKAGEAGDNDGERQKMADAVHELNLQLEDVYPIDQVPVDSGFMGGDAVGAQKCI